MLKEISADLFRKESVTRWSLPKPTEPFRNLFLNRLQPINFWTEKKFLLSGNKKENFQIPIIKIFCAIPITINRNLHFSTLRSVIQRLHFSPSDSCSDSAESVFR